MDSLYKYFDDFTLKARVMPGLTILFPLIPYSFTKGILNSNILENSILNVIIFTIFSAILAFASRNQGKIKEKKLFKEWGAMPTTIIMRFSDDTLNYNSKVRYHKILNDKLPDLQIPLSKEEEDNIIDADEKYKSAIDWLRLNANSNHEKFPLVYAELKNYNFARNLYGLKNIGLIIYTLIGIRECLVINNFNIVNLILIPYPQYISLIIMVVGALIVLFISRKKIVRQRANDYAKALIETCNKLEIHIEENN
ncbi:TPA: hypothetical protein ACKOR7_003913 [Clostridioides difficile]